MLEKLMYTPVTDLQRVEYTPKESAKISIQNKGFPEIIIIIIEENMLLV
jgi:hypothetical protein